MVAVGVFKDDIGALNIYCPGAFGVDVTPVIISHSCKFAITIKITPVTLFYNRAIFEHVNEVGWLYLGKIMCDYDGGTVFPPGLESREDQGARRWVQSGSTLI